MNGEHLEPEQAEEVVRVRYHVKHVLVPMVVFEACECGRTRATQNEGAMGFAEAGADMPPTRCSCGRMVVGYSGRIIEAVQ